MAADPGRCLSVVGINAAATPAALEGGLGGVREAVWWWRVGGRWRREEGEGEEERVKEAECGRW